MRIFPISLIGDTTFYYAMRMTGIEDEVGSDTRLKKNSDNKLNFLVNFILLLHLDFMIICNN